MKQTSKGWYVGDSDSHIGKWVEDSGRLCHDEFLPHLVKKHLKPDFCVIDGGANIGTHTVLYNQVLGLKGLTVAVEAGREAFEALLKNIELFAFPRNIYALQACLSERDGDSVSHISNENLGASHCETVFHRVPGSSYLLTVTIDYLRNQLERKIDFIKLDIEGFELKALLGASKTLQNDRPGLLVEVNPGALLKQGDSEADIYDLLDFHKYSWSIAQPDAKRGDPMYDLLCFPLPLITLELPPAREPTTS